jgi:hypothetical protein
VPFEADNFMGVLSLHLTEPPPQIPDEVFDAVGAPRELAGVIDKALEKDRAARWQTMEELANAVREVCGDPPPGPRGTKEQPIIRATSATPIAAPALTKVPRPKTEAPKQTPRPRTQWTGTVKVPEEQEEAPRSVAEPAARKGGSKLPLVIGGAIVVAGGAVAAALVLSGKPQQASPPPPPGSASVGSQAIVAPPPVTTDAGAASGPLPPAEVEIHFTSTPPGAKVSDLNDKILGVTPFGYKVPGDVNGRQFQVKLDGYDPQVITVPLDQKDVPEAIALVKKGGSVRPPPYIPPGLGSGKSQPKVPADAGVTHAAPVVLDAPAAPPPKPDACAIDPITNECLKGMGGP